MGLKKTYKGYKAYQYLEEDKDYRSFKFPPEIGRVSPYLIPLTSEEEKRYEKIAKDFLFISLHDHPHLYPEDVSEHELYAKEGRCRIAYEGLANSNLDCVFDNLADSATMHTSRTGWQWEDILFDLGITLSDLAHQDFLIRCEKVEDIYRAHKEDRIAVVPSIEGGAQIEHELDRIDILYGFGVREMALTYYRSNTLGTGAGEKKDCGLTNFGEKAVERMNKLGMLIDSPHDSPQMTLDIIEASSKPIVMSHMGARALRDISGFATDEVLKALAKKGGVVGVIGCPHTSSTKQNPHQSIDTFFDHFKYMVDLIGIDHVAFGVDDFYGDQKRYHEEMGGLYSMADENMMNDLTHKDWENIPYVKGLDTPDEASKNIIRWLVKNNYSDEDIEKVLSGNILRVLKEVWK